MNYFYFIFFAILFCIHTEILFAQGSEVFNKFMPYEAKNILNVEKQEGFDVTIQHYDLLEKIFKKIDISIILPENYTKQHALGTCMAISKVLEKDFGFMYTPTRLLSEGMQNHTLDCNYNSVILYSALAKQRKLPVSLILSPGHMFIRWNLPDGTYFNYETTSSVEMQDKEYIEQFHISDFAINNKIFMAPLNDEQAWATSFSEMSCFLDEKEPDKQLKLCDKSLECNSNYVNAWVNKGVSYFYKKDKKALDCFKKAIAIDSTNYKPYFSLGICYSRQKDSKNAISYFTKSIHFNPNDPDIYINRADEYLNLNKVDEAMADFEKASENMNKFTLLGFLSDYVKLRILEQRIMEMYVKLHEK